MNILSKNATAQVSIKKMKNALKGISSDVLLGKQLHPLTNCYSVNLKSLDAPKYIYTNGEGTNELACEASAYGEYIGDRYNGADKSGTQTGRYTVINLITSYEISNNFSIFIR